MKRLFGLWVYGLLLLRLGFGVFEQKLPLLPVVFLQALEVLLLGPLLLLRLLRQVHEVLLLLRQAEPVHLLYLLLQELHLLPLSPDEHLLVVTVQVEVLHHCLPVLIVLNTLVPTTQTILLPILLVHQVQVELVELLRFLLNLFHYHVLYLKDVYFLYHSDCDIDQGAEQKIIQIGCRYCV